MGFGHALRHRAAQGRRRVHLRRGDGALQLDRGLPRRAAQQAAVPGRRRPVRQADGGQQRRDAWSTCSDIVLEGGAAFAGIGTERLDRHAPVLPVRLRRAARPVRGAVRRHAARGARRWRAASPAAATLQAVLLGGAAGGFVGPDDARPRAVVRGDARGRRDAGLGRGHGLRRHASTCVPILLRIAAFFRDESCGQCVPCRVGTVRQEEALAAPRVGAAARAASRTSSRCSTRSRAAMRDASICGLGQTAANAIESAISEPRRLRAAEEPR